MVAAADSHQRTIDNFQSRTTQGSQDFRRTRKFAETGQQVVQVVLVHLATVSKRLDLADDVLIL